MDIPAEYQKNIWRGVTAFLVLLSLFFAVKVLSEFKAYRIMTNTGANTITISGHGEVTAVPDIAIVSFSITKEAKTVKEAQDMVAEVEASALEFLRENEIANKDIKAFNASFYPKYEYEYRFAPCYGFDCPPDPARSIITGYRVTESIEVKIRNTDDAGEIIAGLGALGITELSGPNFSIDDEEALKREARKLAIENAEEKAEALTDDLGVRLGRVSSFSEGGDFFPVYMRAESAMDKAGSVAPAELPKGENIISSSVTITYEIR